MINCVDKISLSIKMIELTKPATIRTASIRIIQNYDFRIVNNLKILHFEAGAEKRKIGILYSNNSAKRKYN